MRNLRRLFVVTLGAVMLLSVPLSAQPGPRANPTEDVRPDDQPARSSDDFWKRRPPPRNPKAPTDRIRLHKNRITLPFVINRPGSYVLTSDLTGVAGEDGIIIAASDVTIDLNGFTLRGVEGSGAGIIYQKNSGVVRTTLLNGAVIDWSGPGVDLRGVRQARCTSMQIISNAEFGLWLASSALVESCEVSMNLESGILVGQGSTVRNCLADRNGYSGIYANSFSRISDCIARQNGGTGIVLEPAGVVEDCTITENGSHGIQLRIAVGTARRCFVSGNAMDGINADIEALIEDCKIFASGDNGIEADDRSRIIRCVVEASTSFGVFLGEQSELRESTIAGNGDDDSAVLGGVLARRYCTIEDNVFRRFGRGGWGPPALIQMDTDGVFQDNKIEGGNVSITDCIVVRNLLTNGATLSATGPGVAPIVESIAEAGPHDNIRLP